MQPYGGAPPPGYGYPPAPPGSASIGPGLRGPIVGTVGLVFLLLALVGPWWSFTMNLSVPPLQLRGSVDFGLFGGQVSVLGFGLGIGYNLLPAIGGAFLVTALLVGIAAVCGMLMVVAGAMSRKNPNWRKAAAVFGVLGLALAAGAPGFAMVSLPSAANADGMALAQQMGLGANLTGGTGPGPFWGSEVLPGVGSMSWGAGWGWYASFLGGIILLIGAILTLRTRPVAPLPTVPPITYPQYPAPYPGPTPAPVQYPPSPPPASPPYPPPQPPP